MNNNEMCGCAAEEKTSSAKGIVRINYKEDFELVVELLAGDKPYKLGDEDFRIDFCVLASRYTVGRTAGVCERCSVVDGYKIRCFMDNHGLPPGELRAEVKVNTPDPNYADGKRLNVAMAEGTVVLVKDNTRFDGAVIKANIPVALVDAELSETSENPIMNKAVAHELAETMKDAEVYHRIAMLRMSGKKEIAEKEFISLFATRIPRGAFMGFTELNKFTFPNGIKSIEINAFRNCTLLKSITIPDGVTSIGEGAFLGCTSLADISLPNNLKSIEEYAFRNCTSLKSITIPDGVTSIGEGAFLRCSSLTKITIPEKVKEINSGTFDSCAALTSVNIPDGVTSIGEWAFSFCTSLADISLPNNLKSIGKRAFQRCPSLKSITIPDGVTSIGEGAFLACTSLADISLPNNLKSIGEYAFQDCTQLKSVTIPAGMTEMQGGAFYNCPLIMHMTVDKNNKIYDSRNGCNAVIQTATGTIVAACNATVIPNDVNKIGESAFAALAFTEIILPNGVTEIGKWAFWGCASLTNITIPDTVKSIGASALKKCTSLATITFNGTMKQWGEIDKQVDWNLGVKADAVIHCTDGDIPIN